MSAYDLYCEFYDKFHNDFPEIYLSIYPNSIIIESQCFNSFFIKKFCSFFNSKVATLEYKILYIQTGVRLIFEFKFYV